VAQSRKRAILGRIRENLIDFAKLYFWRQLRKRVELENQSHESSSSSSSRWLALGSKVQLHLHFS
jgi:predicted Zn-dependent protease